MVEIILIVAGILYLLLVLGYIHQFIEHYMKEDSVFNKSMLKFMMIPIMFFLIPFLVGMCQCLDLQLKIYEGKKNDETRTNK